MHFCTFALLHFCPFALHIHSLSIAFRGVKFQFPDRLENIWQFKKSYPWIHTPYFAQSLPISSNFLRDISWTMIKIISRTAIPKNVSFAWSCHTTCPSLTYHCQHWHPHRTKLSCLLVIPTPIFFAAGIEHLHNKKKITLSNIIILSTEISYCKNEKHKYDVKMFKSKKQNVMMVLQSNKIWLER